MEEADLVSHVLRKLSDAAAGASVNKAREVQGVSRQIKQMDKELGLIQALLRDADSKRNRNELVTEWLNDVRVVADRINGVIDTFRVKIKKIRRQRYNCYRNNKTYKLSLQEDMKDIIQQLNQLYQRRTDLGIKDLGALDDVDDPEPSDKVDDPEVVGLDEDKCKIMKQLLNSNISRRTVLSIVGVVGLGKTTLAKEVYKSSKLEEHFDCRAWLNISPKFNLSDLLRKILYSIKPKMMQQNPPVTDEDLLVELKSSLSFKRYLIVLDDVWTIDLWEQLRIALPDTNNASRVIITSRLIDVAKAADCNTEPYKLHYLNDDESLALLFIKAFGQHIQPNNYHLDILEVAKKITKKCGGLPLALSVLGNTLSRRETNYTAWSTFEQTIDWQKDWEICMELLAESYEDLPYDLKPCFLYFSAFPKDYKISGKHITKMWVAEGFIREDGGGTMEDRAEAYLEELVQRREEKVAPFHKENERANPRRERLEIAKIKVDEGAIWFDKMESPTN